MRRHAWAALLTVLVVMVVAGCRQSESQEPTPSQGVSATGGQRSVPANWPERLTLHVIPSQAQGPMQEAMNRLAAQLSREVGIPIDIKVASDYAAVVEAMNYGKCDIAFFGPYTYVVANAQSGCQAFVTQLINGQPYYHSYMIVPTGSPIHDLEQIRGKKVAFGDPSSTSSSLIPRLEMKKAGIDWRKDVQAQFTGGHDAVLAAVANGSAEVGFLDSAIFENSLSKKMPDAYAKVRVAWKSAELYQYPWAHRKDLPADLVERLREAFLKVTDPTILAAFGATGFTATDDSKYGDVREAAAELGIDLKRERLAK